MQPSTFLPQIKAALLCLDEEDRLLLEFPGIVNDADDVVDNSHAVPYLSIIYLSILSRYESYYKIVQSPS